MFITKKALPRRTFLRAHGRDGRAAVARRDGAGALGARAQADAAPRLRLHRQRRHPEPVDAGRRPAPASICRRSCSRSPTSATRSTSSAACRTCRPTPSATAPAIIRARRPCGSPACTPTTARSRASRCKLATTADQIIAARDRQDVADPVARAVGRLPDAGLAAIRATASTSTRSRGGTRRRRTPPSRIRASCSSGCSATAAAPRRARRAAQSEGSILDSVREEASRVASSLGRGDRAKLGEYLDSVREIEQRIQNAEAQPVDIELPERPTDIPPTLRRAHEADVRPAGAGVPGRHHARVQHDHVARAEHDDLRRASACPSSTTPCRTTATIPS